MTHSAAIRKVMETYLSETSDVPVIVWENQAADPAAGVPFIRTRFEWERKVAAIGVGAAEMWQGTLRLTLYMPEKKGPRASDELVDMLMARFANGTIITNGVTRVICLDASRGLSVNENGWHVVPLDIEWRCYKGE